MVSCETIAVLRQEVCRARAIHPGGPVGLVPTMGALHAGHVSLIEAARADCAVVVVSIFVNPTQFGPNEDYARYPRCMAEDRRCCEAAAVDILFGPTVDEMYGSDSLTRVQVRRISEGLCGRQRPGHFDGVALVVCKLFHMVRPERAYFGQKDAQQLAVIRRMVVDLNIPVQVVDRPTVREPDGLALSSRNRLLDASQRQQAAALYRSLARLRDAVSAGERDPGRLRTVARGCLEQAGISAIEYLELVDPVNLQPVNRVDRPVLAALAVRIGGCRLIDNLLIEANDSAG